VALVAEIFFFDTMFQPNLGPELQSIDVLHGGGVRGGVRQSMGHALAKAAFHASGKNPPTVSWRPVAGAVTRQDRHPPWCTYSSVHSETPARPLFRAEGAAVEA